MTGVLQMPLAIFSSVSLTLPLGKLQIFSILQKRDACCSLTLTVGSNCPQLNHSQIKKKFLKLTVGNEWLHTASFRRLTYNYGIDVKVGKDLPQSCPYSDFTRKNKDRPLSLKNLDLLGLR